MKYLNKISFALLATLISQDALALSEGTIEAAKAQAKNQQAGAQLLATQNARLGVLGLAQDANHRAALTALGALGIVDNANNVAAAAALINANGAAIAVNLPNLVATRHLEAYITAGNRLTQLQIDAVKNANAINSGTRDAMVWAITNGFGGQAIGTVPVGIAVHHSNTGTGNHRFEIKYGLGHGWAGGHVAGNNTFLIHKSNAPINGAVPNGRAAANPPVYIVFNNLQNDGVNAGMATVQDLGIKP